MEAIIFDLDGVLCSTDEFHYKAWKKLCDEKGLIFNRYINEKLRGIGRLESYKIILKENGIKEDISIMNESIKYKNELYRKYLSIMDNSFVSKDVTDTLKKLKSMKIKIAVGSSSKNAPYILMKTELLKYFDVVVDGNMIMHSKPNPEVFVKAADLLNSKYEETLVVEDAESGVIAALSAGMVAIAYRQPKLNNTNKNLFFINEISEILKFI